MEFKTIDPGNIPTSEVLAKNKNGETMRGYIYSWPLNKGGIFCSNSKRKIDLNAGGEFKLVSAN